MMTTERAHSRECDEDFVAVLPIAQSLFPTLSLSPQRAEYASQTKGILWIEADITVSF